MENFKRYMVSKSAWGIGKSEIRMVNQPEIINYITKNPGRTENQIMEDIYGYYRNSSNNSNKKYADCLRRALYSGKISRVKSHIEEGIRYIYFTNPDLAPQ